MLRFKPSLPDRDIRHLENDPTWLTWSQSALIVVGQFDARGCRLEVVLVELGALDPSCKDVEVFPLGCDKHWAALARDPQSLRVLGLYEFYAGPANLFDATRGGARLVGKAIAVDACHLRRGIGRGLLETLYGSGIMIIPAGPYTEGGAGLLQAIEEGDKVRVPPEGAVTAIWPPAKNVGTAN